MVLVLCTGLGHYIHFASQHTDGAASLSPLKGIAVGQIIVGILTATTSSLLPRRPEVYEDGRVVDAQYTATALGRSAA